MRQKIDDKTYEFDEAAVQYSKLTDKEAKARVQLVKDRINELKSDAELSDDPRKIYELRQLYSARAWYRLNKNRSKYFKIVTSGPSMRKAQRHPDVTDTKRRGKN